MTRIVLAAASLIAAALVLAAPAALAQVATTDLVPAAPIVLLPGSGGIALPADTNVVPDNPAAQHWGMPSRFGAGTIDAERQRPNQAADNFDGFFAALRWTQQEQWTGGLEIVDVDGTDYEESNKGAALTYGVSEAFALGLGARLGDVESGGATRDVNRLSLGLSLKVGENIFLGYAMGTDDLEETDAAGVTTEDDSRGVAMYGAAFRTGEGETRWYIAYDVVDADPFTDTGGNDFGGFERSSLTLQVIYREILLGFSDVSVDFEPGAGELEATVMDLGWAPEMDLAVSLRLISGEETDGTGTKRADDEMTAINVAYRF